MIPGTLFLGVYDVYAKKILKSGIDERLLLGATFLASGSILLAATMVIGMPEIQDGFWSAYFITFVFNIFAQLAWYKAFKREEASLISPLRLITPPLVIISGYLVLSETPTIGGMAGIFITILGFWFLLDGEANFEGVNIFGVIKRPGVLFGILGAISFAITFPFDKQAVVTSSAIFFSGAVNGSIGLGNLFLYLIFADAKSSDFKFLKEARTDFPVFVLLHTIGGYLAFQSLQFTLAAYAASVKRLWSLWAVIFSGQFLKEDNIRLKLLATLIMLSGIVVTVIYG